MEATAVLQSHPADGCHATKEDLIADGLKGIEFCPICFEDHNIRCEVANHPPATVPGLVIGKIICRVSGQVSPEETIPIANEVVGNGPRGSVHHYFALFQYRIHRRFSSYEVNLSFFYAVQRQFVVVTGDEITRTKFPADTACILKNHYMCYAFADTEAAHNITWSNLIAMYKRNVHEMIAGHSRYDNVPNPDEVGILSPFRLSPYAITDKGYNCNIL